MIFLLDIYDILKRIRKGLRTNDKLVTKTGAIYASDETNKEYTVVNHVNLVQT